MHRQILCFAALLALFQLVQAAVPPYKSKPFAHVLAKREAVSNDSDLTVDLGYEKYQGQLNSTSGLNTWLGVPGYNITGSEDCLFLSVYAPPKAQKLPVIVWIHGGGYNIEDGTQDMSMLINENEGAFIGVAIQYRLGAFGFLSSDEVMRYGAPNAGLLDMHFALQWVQSYIHLFGGDPSKVTISGESAGGGAVMLLGLAFGGYLGNSLFSNIHAASPYLQQQWGYADFVPSQSYYAFAAAVGCFGPPAPPQTNISTSIFQCLVGKDTETLQNASATLSGSARLGSYAFLPVTDGVFLQQLPSQQLLEQKLNGVNLLVGNNANEGAPFAPPDVATADDFVSYVQNSFPLFISSDIDKLLTYYPLSSISTNSSSIRFATNGTTPPLTALNESSYNTGPQQAAANLFAETTFVCPAYWLAEAYSCAGRKSYKFQYSSLLSQHGADVSAYFGPARPDQGTELVRAVMHMLGNFILTGNPSISLEIARGGGTGRENGDGGQGEGSNDLSPEADVKDATSWPPFTVRQPLQLNLNTTGGMNASGMGAVPGQPNITITTEPGVRNVFRLVDAFEWEGGRGQRCDFWRGVGSVVPE